jgi:hypothetical protein
MQFYDWKTQRSLVTNIESRFPTEARRQTVLHAKEGHTAMIE